MSDDLRKRVIRNIIDSEDWRASEVLPLVDRLAKLEKVASVAKALKTTSYTRLENGGRFLIDEHDWYAFCEALKALDEEGAVKRL